MNEVKEKMMNFVPVDIQFLRDLKAYLGTLLETHEAYVKQINSKTDERKENGPENR